MNLFVADPDWGWWIIGYFFLGGIAAGAFFLSALIDLFGGEDDRPLCRAGYLIAFPLILVCGLFLTLDLNRPERFWHMLVQSEVFHETWLPVPMLKPWSPMSIGSWALALFGAFSLPTFLASLRPEGRIARLLRWRWLRGGFLVLGCGVGFFVASYTGVLLTATSQPLWSQTDWLGPLFLASAASTGLATMRLLARHRRLTSEGTLHKLERADLWMLGLELVVFIAFLLSLGSSLMVIWNTLQGKILILGPLLLGLLLPLALRQRWWPMGQWHTPAAGVAVLVGGFLLRYAVVMTPPEILAHKSVITATPAAPPPAWLVISPEDGRKRGGGPGASSLNRTESIAPRTKIPEKAEP